MTKIVMEITTISNDSNSYKSDVTHARLRKPYETQCVITWQKSTN